MTNQKVIMYCRKSSESEDRQALSIDSQIRELKEYALRAKLEVVDIITEAKSAKEPGRPNFSKLISRLDNHEVDAILCWKLDRLSRNPVDGGSILWLVKKGVKIFTPGQIYSHANESDLVMYMEFGMAQKFIDDLGKSVRRGLKTKAEIGWYPAHAPTGYLNPPGKKGFKEIISDPLRFPLVRKVFDSILDGKQAVLVWQEAINCWHLTTPLGKPMSRSAFYNMLNNPFYYGEFAWPKKSDNWYTGKHKPVITNVEFDLVQKMLGKFGKPVARSHIFDLTGLFRCDHCECSITGTKKTKYYKTTARSATYTYYHCTHKRLSQACTMPPITESEANKQIVSLLGSIRPPQEFIDWAKRWVHVVARNELSGQKAVAKSRHHALTKVEQKLNTLLDMRLGYEVSEEVYSAKKKSLEEEKQKLLNGDRNQLDPDSEVREINNTLDFAKVAVEKYSKGNRDDKHFVLLKVGSNLLLKPKQIWINFKPEYLALKDSDTWGDRYTVPLEPQKYSDTLSKYPDLVPANPIWLPSHLDTIVVFDKILHALTNHINLNLIKTRLGEINMVVRDKPLLLGE